MDNYLKYVIIQMTKEMANINLIGVMDNYIKYVIILMVKKYNNLFIFL